MKDSNKLRNQVIYQVFVRQYGKNHNFDDVRNDLDRIKKLGTDIIYLLPIFPIGKKNRKGSIGSPYAISDYDTIDSFLGGKEQLVDLINETHQKDMKIIVDLALNHTGCDAKLLKMNKDFYYHKNGRVSRKCDDWSDVYDLDYDNKKLYPHIINSVCNLAKMGFDGFRMDVCTLIPMKFWRVLYKELLKINEDIIMIGESVHLSFRDYIRTLGVNAPSDMALYQVFDCLYQYDICDAFDKMKDSCLADLDKYLIEVEKQNNRFNKPKLRYLENHDTPRIASYNIPNLETLWVLDYMLPGTTFLYNGCEYLIKHRPDLFEVDPIDFENKKADLSGLFKKLSELKKFDYFYINKFEIVLLDKEAQIYVFKYQNDNKELYCYFSFDKLIKVKNNNQNILLADSSYTKNEEYISANNYLILEQ